MNAQGLINAIEAAFGYTADNNRDLVGDPTFPIGEVVEELMVEAAKNFLVAYTIRNEAMINSNMED